MFRFLVPLALLATASSIHIRAAKPQYRSAASESQIKFAIENNYDNTGPGAKQPEYAYNTYTNIEDALVGYLDDPDTKLPEHERAKAVQRLVNPPPFYPGQPIERFHPKTVEEYTGYNAETPQRPVNEKKVLNYFQGPVISPGLSAYDDNDLNLFKGFERKPSEQFRLHKVQAVKGSPLSVAHYTRGTDYENQDQYHAHPKYSFSYGVHDKDTGDSKAAQETREGGKVRGYYSFVDPDGKQRIVHYTADDQQGFLATVQRTSAHQH